MRFQDPSQVHGVCAGVSVGFHGSRGLCGVRNGGIIWTLGLDSGSCVPMALSLCLGMWFHSDSPGTLGMPGIPVSDPRRQIQAGTQMASSSVDLWLWRLSPIHTWDFFSTLCRAGWVGDSAGQDLQLQGWGDVEKAADGRLESQGTGRARAVQMTGLEDGRDQQEEFRACQAFPEADTLS